VDFGRNHWWALVSTSRGGQVASTYRLQEQITGMMLGGATLNRVEHELLDPSGLSPERKAPLRLYALSYVGNAADHRRQATSFRTSRA
jgi:hypothetical protein